MYKWNEEAKRYQWFNGKAYFVSRDTVLAWVDTSIAKTGAIADTLAGFVSSGNISPADWYGMMQRHIKDEVVRQYITGIGGRSQMTQADWGSVGATTKDQYNYLRGFYETLKGGNLTEGQIRARARMYINSAREAFEKATRKVAKKWGADEVIWVRDPAVENCGGCLDYSALGWVPLVAGVFNGNVPGSGGTVCLTSCHCHLEYRNSKTNEVYMSE